MSHEESLNGGRTKRANAGSRLRHLIELEEQAAQELRQLSQFISEEDENVNLIFQEDENDEEFQESEEYSDEVEEVEDGNGENEEAPSGENEGVEEEDGEDTEMAEVDSDDVLSQTDLSSSETDESEGEKELQKQEKMVKRRRTKMQTMVPAIRKQVDTTTSKSKRVKKTPSTSSSLLFSERRSSSRAAVVESKEALVKRLKENEKRKANSTPVVRIKQRELTQEEKLAEAIATEKANVLSLNKFQEQEVEKKEKQRQLMLLKRKKLKNVIRLLSEETYISPLDEVLDARRAQEILRKAKRKPGRKRKVPLEPVFQRLPGEVDTELPLVKEELDRKRREDEELQKNAQNEENQSEIIDGNGQGNSKEQIDGDIQHNNLENGVSLNEETNGKLQQKNVAFIASEVNLNPNGNDENNENDEKISIHHKESRAPTDDAISRNDSAVDLNLDEESSQCNKYNDNNEQQHAKHGDKILSPNNEGTIDDNLNVAMNETIKSDENNENSLNGGTTNYDEIVINTAETNQTESIKSELPKEKKVTFADELENASPKIESDDEMTPDPSIALKEKNEVFEGPSQRVGKNSIFLIDFEEEEKTLKLTESNIKSILLGPQSLLPASRRFKDLESILRIGKVDNPYVAVREERDEILEPASSLTENDPIFDELNKLPRLGVAQAIVEEVEEDDKEEDFSINLKTEAPTGLYLPNGNKKNCLISGTEVKYFDPSNGIPYNSVETYRFLKTIEQGAVPWYSLGNELNDNGPVDIYLGSRVGAYKHAKDVPEGFDGN
ncbi:uncharacterized protein PRCAT00002829001 [Priceomyces carsonii]|uniref:uncharacterized protein n=1 Tax=Priceomyces carsonii TaxID=28549 RepID=UPI002ED78381|nr:unnamed protein product [Priceomyces carsonii]